MGTVPDAIAPGGTFSTTYSVVNGGQFPAIATTTRFYLSLDVTKSTNDKLLTGTHALAALSPGQTIMATTGNITVPANTLPGAYHVIACVDALHQVVELYEENNCQASNQTMLVGKPDLRVLALANAPVATVGAYVGIDVVTVRNDGAVASLATSLVRFYLSEDNTKSTNDRLLGGAVGVPPLEPFSQYTPTSLGFFTIPLNTPVGTYYLIACADADTDVAESDETDNCRTSTQTVNVTKSDLVISSVGTTAVTAARGTVIQVTDTTFNQGLGTAFQSTTTRYYLSLDQAKSPSDKQLSGNRIVPSLYAGESSTGTVDVTIPSNTIPAVYWLLACADSTGQTNELNETNNCTASPSQITVTP
jgi:subtilase family serine protease